MHYLQRDIFILYWPKYFFIQIIWGYIAKSFLQYQRKLPILQYMPTCLGYCVKTKRQNTNKMRFYSYKDHEMHLQLFCKKIMSNCYLQIFWLVCNLGITVAPLLYRAHNGTPKTSAVPLISPPTDQPETEQRAARAEAWLCAWVSHVAQWVGGGQGTDPVLWCSLQDSASDKTRSNEVPVGKWWDT